MFPVKSVTSFPKTTVSWLQNDKFYVNKGEASGVCFSALDWFLRLETSELGVETMP
jgi:hypothetical protein